jgi:hypothetical protein
MTEAIKVNVERNIIPFTVGDVKLEFNASDENFARFMAMGDPDEGDFVANQLGDLEPEFDALKDKMADPQQQTAANYARFVELEKLGFKRMYDLLFGEGTFDKLYKAYPDVAALGSIMQTIADQLALAIAVRMKTRADKLEAQSKSVAAEALARKAAKRQQSNISRMPHNNRNHRRHNKQK